MVEINESKKPVVSTITACYNMEKYLPKFLEELPRQTIFENLQIVLDHNDPTDDEVELVKKFQHKFPGTIKHIITRPVIKQSASWNKCIREADADLVTIWNVDDLRTPDSLEKQTSFLKNHENFGAVHGNFVIVNSFGAAKGRMIDHSYTLSYTKELTRSMVLGPFFMFRKSLCEKIGYFDEQLYSGADFDLAIRLATRTKIGMVPGVLGYFLDEGRGASTRPNNKQSVERTLIEMRYNILDKLQSTLVPDVLQNGYDVENVYLNNKAIPISSLIESFDDFKKANCKP